MAEETSVRFWATALAFCLSSNLIFNLRQNFAHSYRRLLLHSWILKYQVGIEIVGFWFLFTYYPSTSQKSTWVSNLPERKTTLNNFLQALTHPKLSVDPPHTKKTYKKAKVPAFKFFFSLFNIKCGILYLSTVKKDCFTYCSLFLSDLSRDQPFVTGRLGLTLKMELWESVWGTFLLIYVLMKYIQLFLEIFNVTCFNLI